MRTRLALVSLLALFATPLRAAQAPDPTLTAGLSAWLANGPVAGIDTWYADRPALAGELKPQVLDATKNLGAILDTEVVAIQQISKRVTRYYVAVYYARSPLWLRVERYSNGERTFFFAPRYSTNPDTILPGYLTEFQP
jgi:hypothetical protein